MTTRPATPRKPRARSQARIDAILDAARTLLAAEGVASLSIYSVAERAQIPPSSVYHFCECAGAARGAHGRRARSLPGGHPGAHRA